MDRPRTFITLEELARRTGLPAAWLKREAEEGRLPSLRVGRRLLFNSGEVEQALAQRSSSKEGRRHV